MIPNLPMQQVDFAGAWDAFWSRAQGQLGDILVLAGIVGVLLVVGALVMYFYRKSRGGGGNTTGLVWTMVVGGILAAPAFLIPIILNVVDFVINTIASVAGG